MVSSVGGGGGCFLGAARMAGMNRNSVRMLKMGGKSIMEIVNRGKDASKR